MDRSKGYSRTALFSWALYDWANSAFFAVIQTFVFATYFINSVASGEAVGSNQWGNIISLAGLLIAVGGPLLGAVADQTGRRKPWILGFSLLCIGATAMLWFVAPDSSYLWLALGMIFLGTVGSECAIIFYNAMLTDLAPSRVLGRWSGWAWGLGYAGGLACLLVALLVFIDVEQAPLGLDMAQSEHVRATFLLVALWYAVFSLPLFLMTPDTPRTEVPMRKAVRGGWKQLKESIAQVRSYRHIVRFLIARMLFIDGLATVFAFGGIYAAGTFEMNETQVLTFGIGLNLTAGVGAALFAWIDDRMGSKRTIVISLVGLILTTGSILLVTSELLFWIIGLALGIFVGPVQAAGRSWMARAAPHGLRNQMFGLFALSGKVTAFMGPFLVGWLTWLAGSQRVGMSVIVVLFCLGLWGMLGVPEAGGRASGERPDAGEKGRK